jgi:Protein of unknown function (DUF2950)
MEDDLTLRPYSHRTLRAALLVGTLIVGLASGTTAQQQQQTFASPEEGVAALVEALKQDDSGALEAVLGPGSAEIINSGDPVADKNAKDEFLRNYEAKSTLVPVNDSTRRLQVGESDWPLPIPIVRRDAAWTFDLEAGRDELLNRRIGRNEANAIEAALAFVDAEREYASEDRDGDGILEYAQQFGSTNGMKNGLYWPVQPGEPPSPLGPFFADAQSEGYFQEWSEKGSPAPRPPEPYHGYNYLILTAQGPSVTGGAYDYIVDGNLIGGVAMIAYPAEYGVSGIMTFIVNHDGIVYQRDLGPDTSDIAQAVTAFDPDATWQRVQTPVPVAAAP